MVFQAKRLTPDGRYHGLTQRQPNGLLQADVLLRSCLSRTKKLGGAVWPLYCLYNSWAGGWPRSVPMPVNEDDQTQVVAEDDLPIFGCSVVGAQIVRQVLISAEYVRRRTLLDTYLPLSWPWSSLFQRSRTQHNDAAEVQRRLSACLAAFPPSAHRQRQSIAASSTRHGTKISGSNSYYHTSGRGQSLAWREPSLISEPPEYVRDLLVDYPRPRRLRPLARRVAILTS